MVPFLKYSKTLCSPINMELERIRANDCWSLKVTQEQSTGIFWSRASFRISVLPLGVCSANRESEPDRRRSLSVRKWIRIDSLKPVVVRSAQFFSVRDSPGRIWHVWLAFHLYINKSFLYSCSFVVPGYATTEQMSVVTEGCLRSNNHPLKIFLQQLTQTQWCIRC